MAGTDISNITLTLQPAMTISGSVSFDGTSLPAPNRAGMRVSLAPILTGTEVSVGRVTRVRHHEVDPEPRGALDLGREHPLRHAPQASIRRREVDEVGVVAHRHGDPVCGPFGAKSLHRSLIELGLGPPIGLLAEDLEHHGVERRCPGGRLVDAAPGRHMSAELVRRVPGHDLKP